MKRLSPRGLSCFPALEVLNGARSTRLCAVLLMLGAGLMVFSCDKSVNTPPPAADDHGHDHAHDGHDHDHDHDHAHDGDDHDHDHGDDGHDHDHGDAHDETDGHDHDHDEEEEHDHDHDHDQGAEASGTSVDIPPSVRTNLGITFAKAQRRNVERTLRVPGRFEYLPTARREYRTPLRGRVELLVDQYDRVEEGAPLYRVDSAEWLNLHEQIASMQAKVDSMTPLREAHRVHEESLSDKVRLWEERLEQLDELRAAGGGSAAQLTEARATLNATQAELADVMEKDAALEAEHRGAEAELRSLKARHDLLVESGGAAHEHNDETPETIYEVCAQAPGVVESIGVTQGGLADEWGLIVTLVQPERVRFRARGLQSDLGRLRDGLPARIVAPAATDSSMDQGSAMIGPLRLGLTGDADERTIDLLVEPEKLAGWARAGVAASMEIALEGGSERLAVPLSAVVRDGVKSLIFRRDPSNPDRAVRMEVELGVSDGRWVALAPSTKLKADDEVIVSGNYQLMLATSGSAEQGGHFHADGTFHEGSH